LSCNARTNFPGSENDLKEAEGLLREVEAGYKLVLSEARLKVNPDFLVVRRAQAELLRKQGALSHRLDDTNPSSSANWLPAGVSPGLAPSGKLQGAKTKLKELWSDYTKVKLFQVPGRNAHPHGPYLAALQTGGCK